MYRVPDTMSTEAVVPIPCLSTSVIVRSWMLRFAILSASLTRSRGSAVVEIPYSAELSLERLHRHLARDLAGGVAAHAVGDDEQPVVAFRVDGIIIFVPRPDHTNVGSGSVKQTDH